MTKRNTVFANNLKLLRTRAGLTQDDIKSNLGINRSTWANYEKGLSTPYVNELMKISDFWGVDETTLLRNADLKKDIESGKVKPKSINSVQEPQGRYAQQDELLTSLEDIALLLANTINERKMENRETKKKIKKA